MPFTSTNRLTLPRSAAFMLGTGLLIGLGGSLLMGMASVPDPEATEDVQTVWTDPEATTEPLPEVTVAPQTPEPDAQAPEVPEAVTEPPTGPSEPPVDYPHDVTEDQATPGTEDEPVIVEHEPEPRDYVAEFEADGLTVGDVIVCPPGLSVAIDEYEDGTTWAACQ